MSERSGTVRYTAKQIQAKVKHGEDRTNWRKVNAMIGKKLEASIQADPDDVCGEPDWTKAIRGALVPKDRANIRIDHNLL